LMRTLRILKESALPVEANQWFVGQAGQAA
jgi:hypothetical protein